MALTGVHTHNHWGLHDVKFQFGTFSPLLLARILGILGLVGILTGAFDIGYVQSTLIVAGNPSATLHNMLAHETLFRLGFASHLFELVLNIPGEIIAFYLFRRVKVIVAAVALCCGVVGNSHRSRRLAQHVRGVEARDR